MAKSRRKVKLETMLRLTEVTKYKSEAYKYTIKTTAKISSG